MKFLAVLHLSIYQIVALFVLLPINIGILMQHLTRPTEILPTNPWLYAILAVFNVLVLWLPGFIAKKVADYIHR